jgi:hypothetical protein
MGHALLKILACVKFARAIDEVISVGMIRGIQTYFLSEFYKFM